ncbi:hypothetical protein [Actinophytocola glycyrrhizae]|uniref:SGNH hydrolase-type esterase domain-containing protein n=1 Tax=Actinophytocola glycyrrhizae TaxID=2044873 RepID=A0ABV9S663_9PSEU
MNRPVGYEFVDTGINCGIDCDTSADQRARLDTDIVACRPAAVTILVGANDVRDSTPLDRSRPAHCTARHPARRC